MFDGLDDRVLKIVVQARDETLRLGHDYVGTEHLILALLAEEDMAAARSLELLGGIEPLVGGG